MDGAVHRLAVGASYFSDLSIWDIYRTQMPLMSLLRPDVATSVVDSLLAMYSDGGALPRWPLATVYTGCMVGSHANIIVADAFFRGIALANASLAVEATWRALRDPTLPHVPRDAALLRSWLDDGFMPDNLPSSDRTAAVALDWAYDDG